MTLHRLATSPSAADSLEPTDKQVLAPLVASFPALWPVSRPSHTYRPQVSTIIIHPCTMINCGVARPIQRPSGDVLWTRPVRGQETLAQHACSGRSSPEQILAGLLFWPVS